MDLPAYTFVHPPEQPRKKPQNLNFTDGYPEVRALDYRAAVRGHPPWSTTRLDIYKGYPPSVTPTRTQVKIEYNDTQENYDNSGACDACTDKLGGPQPQWLKFDKRVLRFYAYFKEGIGERRDENMRVRKCTLYYYLSDGTIHIGEPRQDNSGLLQGIFLKRLKVPDGKGGLLGIKDFVCGKEILIFGHRFHIVSCDIFTRRFLLKYGYDLGKEEITYPGEPLVDYRKSLQKVITHEIKDYAAKQFLELDGKVLRFFCVWDDRENIYGARRPYVFHYFLGDDTVEILEIQERNSGRAPFPMLLRRGRLPKVLPDELLGSKTMMYQKSKEECYKDTDLMIGSYVKVWNRDMLLHDADDFTKAYYKTKYGYTDDMLMPVNVQEPTPILARMEVPPHNGWGTEEDSMMNVIHLMPRSWPKDFFKMMNNGGKILCYACKMAEDANHWVSPVDKTRFFVFQFFLEDDSLSVFEPPARNAGVVNGRYMHRQPSLRKPGTLEAYIPEDFYVGARIELHDRLFDLIKADEWTLKFMEENKDKFPMADFSKVRRKLADQIRQLPEDIKADLTKKIPASNLQCESPGISRPSSPNVAPVDNSKEPVGNLLARAGLKLTQHELITLERNCGRVDSEFEDLQSLLKSMIEAK
ncbi:EF-hand domain-containing protein 1 [Marchantia polymorpha subsp. ruderalis]|uniref:DM10 domain-containing protein n=1 Tax=Marchantia polymorpha TaxID=3197 RepID=A0A2R6XIV9_MARPO|nr:hypothetical protein MARPO_0013s0200 [Marchantia polymorpha]BBN18835.1 hypothetical protein Mp_8g05900 [Marchantia polymorpha subsp. ruderalis]|eukprot:PTQ46009.1 hypothetical protein MARPO_0013s0200 [Marchantia polymorpha]